MTTVEIIILAVALAMDAFSVSVSAGPRCCPRFGALRLAASFGGFQGFMPLLGALAGSFLYVYVSEFDHWVAFGLLQLVGWKMVFDALRHWKDGAFADEGNSFDPSRGLSLIVLSIATSIDAFGAGMSMHMVGANLWIACPVIGLTAALLSYGGARLGLRAGHYLGRKAELLGGLVLIGLGIKMLGI